MGTHDRHGFDHLLLDSVTEQVLRKARCPVLAVCRPAHDFVAPADRSGPVRLQRVLFCTDFSLPSDRALDKALSLAREYHAELPLLHVIEQIRPSSDL